MSKTTDDEADEVRCDDCGSAGATEYSLNMPDASVTLCDDCFPRWFDVS